jgi:hypothetical protein
MTPSTSAVLRPLMWGLSSRLCVSAGVTSEDPAWETAAVFLRHYLSCFRPPVDESVLVEAGPSLDDRLFWPTFLLTVGGSWTAATAFSVMTLAALEGGFQGPGLSWPELLVAAAQRDRARTRAERLLLLSPALGGGDLAHDAEDLVATAFTTIGGRPEHRRTVAGELLAASGRFWGAPAWTWHEHHRVCLGGHSSRSLEAPASRHALIAEALAFEG